jgi:hypothetical protein
MSATSVRALPTQGVPADLLVLQRRLANAGVQVRLPTARSGYRLPEPWEMGGDSLTDTVVRLRDRDAEA